MGVLNREIRSAQPIATHSVAGGCHGGFLNPMNLMTNNLQLSGFVLFGTSQMMVGLENSQWISIDDGNRGPD